MNRRSFARHLGVVAAGIPAWSEMAFAQRAAAGGEAPPDTAWLNANENPEGPHPAALDAARAVLAETGRYHYQEFRNFYATVARSEGLEVEQVLVGAGSSEILHAAVDAFSNSRRPLIVMDPTYELAAAVASAQGTRVVKVPLASNYAADVKALVAEAKKASEGSLVYVCNPNNPSGALTPAADMQYLLENLPSNSMLVVDEAYLHFRPDMDKQTLMPAVKRGQNLVISRSFSKIYGMAGLRVGFACARPDLIARMEPFRNNVISIVSARATIAALGVRDTMIPDRRARINGVRDSVCEWLDKKNVKFVKSSANFVFIDIGRDVRTVQGKMLAKGVAVGRPFPPLFNMLRVSIGPAPDMEKFKKAFDQVVLAG